MGRQTGNLLRDSFLTASLAHWHSRHVYSVLGNDSADVKRSRQSVRSIVVVVVVAVAPFFLLLFGLEEELRRPRGFDFLGAIGEEEAVAERTSRLRSMKGSREVVTFLHFEHETVERRMPQKVW